MYQQSPSRAIIVSQPLVAAMPATLGANRALRRARARIADPERWTVDAYARDDADRPVRPGSVAACRWDACGAIDVETTSVDDSDRALIALAAAVGMYASDDATTVTAIARVNDEDGHAAILAALDRAIAATTIGSRAGGGERRVER